MTADENGGYSRGDSKLPREYPLFFTHYQKTKKYKFRSKRICVKLVHFSVFSYFQSIISTFVKVFRHFSPKFSLLLQRKFAKCVLSLNHSII